MKRDNDTSPGSTLASTGATGTIALMRILIAEDEAKVATQQQMQKQMQEHYQNTFQTAVQQEAQKLLREQTAPQTLDSNMEM